MLGAIMSTRHDHGMSGSAGILEGEVGEGQHRFCLSHSLGFLIGLIPFLAAKNMIFLGGYPEIMKFLDEVFTYYNIYFFFPAIRV